MPSHHHQPGVDALGVPYDRARGPAGHDGGLSLHAEFAQQILQPLFRGGLQFVDPIERDARESFEIGLRDGTAARRVEAEVEDVDEVERDMPATGFRGGHLQRLQRGIREVSRANDAPIR